MSPLQGRNSWWTLRPSSSKSKQLRLQFCSVQFHTFQFALESSFSSVSIRGWEKFLWAGAHLYLIVLAHIPCSNVSVAIDNVAGSVSSRVSADGSTSFPHGTVSSPQSAPHRGNSAPPPLNLHHKPLNPHFPTSQDGREPIKYRRKCHTLLPGQWAWRHFLLLQNPSLLLFMDAIHPS